MGELEKPNAKRMAVVIGADGGIGRAVTDRLRQYTEFSQVIGFSRKGDPPIDLTSPSTIEGAARFVGSQGADLRLLFVATGFLHSDAFTPERSLREVNADHMAKAFAVNAIGPALIMKHFVPLLPRRGRSVFAVLSAKVGSIADNKLGGWHSYRASKAALNQIVRTAAIELRRTHPEAICVALHPGTTATGLSAPFALKGLDPKPVHETAQRILAVIDGLSAKDSGHFIDYRGAQVPW